MEKEKTIRNPLHSAAEAGDVTEIESLLALGFSIDERDDEGVTPLMIAAVNNKLQAVKCLLKQGADPSLQDSRGRNVLHYASQGGNPEVIELMLSHVPNIDSITKDGVTPLMIAAINDKLQAVKYLLKQGANASLNRAAVYCSAFGFFLTARRRRAVLAGGSVFFFFLVLSVTNPKPPRMMSLSANDRRFLSSFCHVPPKESFVQLAI